MSTQAPLAVARQRYLAAVLAGDPHAAMDVVEGARSAGHALAVIYREVLERSMHQVGRLWETKELSVAEEHMASEITSSVITRTSPAPLPRAEAGPLAVVACPAPERHALGGQALTAALADAGWRVMFLGADTPAATLGQFVATHAARVVALSVKDARCIGAARAAAVGLKALPDPPAVLLGGTAVRGDGARSWDPIDLVTDDVAEALAWLAFQRAG